jgi:hypothetical protein
MSMNNPCCSSPWLGVQLSRTAPGRSGPLLRQSCSLRVFLRARLRAKAAFTRFLSPGFK